MHHDGKMLPLEYWEEAVDAAIYISNVVALARDVKSTDGDAPRPIERISFGRVSRRQCDHMIHHFQTPGTLCLVPTPKVQGSNIAMPARQRWGVVIRMLGSMPVFECPFSRTTFRSKDYRKVVG